MGKENKKCPSYDCGFCETAPFMHSVKCADMECKWQTKATSEITFDFDDVSDGVLNDLFHACVWEMNKRKAAKEEKDVGFWDSEGNYVPDIKLICKFELQENMQPEELE